MGRAIELLTIQAHFPSGDTEGNLARMERLIRKGAARVGDTSLVLFPELAPGGYDPEDAAKNCPEEPDGPSFRRMSAVAAELGLYIAYGYAEAGEGGRVYNSQMLIGPDGKAAANYRKLHLTKGEMKVFTAGNEAVVADTEIGKIGLMICWDLAFPELSRILTLKGAEIILVPAAWDTPWADPFRAFSKSRALDNTVFLATCNHVGVNDGVDYLGESSLYGPDGLQLGCAGRDGEALLQCRVDLDRVEGTRNGYYTMLEDRRTDLY